MDKALIKQHLVNNFKQQLDQLTAGADSTRSYANDEQLKSEGKYDTRATEAKYLADALAQKLEDLKLDLQMLEEIPVRQNSDSISIGSLVQLEHNKYKNWYYLSPVAGGTMLQIEQQNILVISVFSPLGSQLMDAKIDEEILVETPKGDKYYLVLQIQ